MHDPESDIRDIPLSQLELSPGNVRKTPADASAFTELKASIAAHGLLENFTVYTSTWMRRAAQHTTYVAVFQRNIMHLVSLNMRYMRCSALRFLFVC